MSGIISARAWGKVWAYRSTFLLGLLNTVETAIFCHSVGAGAGCDLRPDGDQWEKDTAGHQQSLCGDHAEYTDFASAVFLLLCAGFFRSQYRNLPDRYRALAYTPEPICGGCARRARGGP